MPEQLTDSQGNTIWQAEYKIWGNTETEWKDNKTNFEQNLRYQGQYLDRETGLHYNTFRYFDPDIGRFTQPDPIGLLGGHNLYEYAPNPIVWIDPWGWKPCEVDRPADIDKHMNDLADYRKSQGLPEAGSPLDTSTTAKLSINGQDFYATNGKAIPTTFYKVNAITPTHVEGQAAQQAINAGIKGRATTADLYVDREPCWSCGRSNGIGSLARELGLESITVHSSSGSSIYTPPN